MFEPSTKEHLGNGLRIDYLRSAIQANRIHFPEPVPIFPNEFRPDIQWRLVELYFVRGWSTRTIADRYGVTSRRIQQSLLCWAGHAAARGYLQKIPAEHNRVAPVRVTAPAPAMPAFIHIPAVPVPVFAAQSA